MSQVAEGGEGSRGGNISQRRLLAFPFRYPSPYLWSKYTYGNIDGIIQPTYYLVILYV